MTRFLNKKTSVVTPPQSEPVTTSGFKTFLRVEGDTDDSLIADILVASREACENYTNTVFINTVFKQVQNDFEYNDLAHYSIRDELAYRQDVMTLDLKQPYIKLNKSGLSSVTSVVTYDENNNASTYSSDNYFVDDSNNQVVINENVSLPTNIRSRRGVEVTYTAGFGAIASDVPMAIRQAIYIYAQSMYDFNRDPENLIAEAYDLPIGAKTLLNPYRMEIGING